MGKFNDVLHTNMAQSSIYIPQPAWQNSLNQQRVSTMIDLGVDARSLPSSFGFRMPRIWSQRLFLTLLGIMLGMALSASAMQGQVLQNRIFIIFIGGYVAIVAAVLIAARFYLRKAGGARPIRFQTEDLEIPLSVSSRTVTRIAYGDILSAIVTGTGRRATLILDTKKRAFVFPVREFSDPAAPGIIRGLLWRRIALLPAGAAQLNEMEKREDVATYFSRFKPWATWILIGLLVLVFLVQSFWILKDDVLGLLDMGANASFLVRNGEWFRLVTANLLHATPLHIISNASFAIVVGTIVERQLGIRRFILLILVTGILSQAASALATQAGWVHSFLYSVGISGALFGMLGAQAVLNHRYGGQLPGGYRFPPRTWWVMLGLNFVVLPLAIPQIDIAAHVGGLVSGVVLTWILCRSQIHVTQAPAWGIPANAALFGLAALSLAGIAAGIGHLTDPALQLADRAALIEYAIAAPDTKPPFDNSLSWALATQPSASPKLLDDAFILARRALENARAINPKDKHIPDYIDTLATVQYRRGDLERAIQLEQPLLFAGPLFPSQLARFMDRFWQQHGVRVVGNRAIPIPTLSLTVSQTPKSNGIDITSNPSSADGVVIFALVRDGPKLLGLLRVALAAGSGSDQHLPLNMGEAFNAPHLTIVEFQNTTCRCSASGAQFFPFSKQAASLP